MNKKLLIITLLCSNVYAYCGMFSFEETCKIKSDDSGMKQAITNIIAEVSYSYMRNNVRRYPLYKSELDDNDKILLLNGCYESNNSCNRQETIAEYMNKLTAAYTENGIVTNGKECNGDNYSNCIVSLSDNSLCSRDMSIDLSPSYLLQRSEDKVNLYCLKQIISSRIKDYIEYLQEQKDKKITAKKQLINHCNDNYYNSKDYKQYALKRDNFVNKRNAICINNGYSSLYCYQFSLKDKIGYELQNPAPINTCNN